MRPIHDSSVRDPTKRSDSVAEFHIIRAFSPSHVVRLTGLSYKQLTYWDRTAFFKPYYTAKNRRSPFSRAYSFRDVVGLRTLSVLREEHRVPLQEIRQVARRLSEYDAAYWSELTLYVVEKEVYFREPDIDSTRGLNGQYTHLQMRRLIDDLTTEAEKLKHRSHDQIGRIERNRYVVHRAWVLAGTRIPTKAIWNFSQAGYSAEGIIREYPILTKRDIGAALAHEEKLAKRA